MPHFEELVFAKKDSKPPLPSAGMQISAPIFTTSHPNYVPEFKHSPSKELNSLLTQTVDLFNNFQLGYTKNDENNENLASLSVSLDDDEAGDSTSDSDEGYGSDTTESNDDDFNVSKPKLTLSLSPSRFDLTRSLTTCPKTQHFAKTLTVFSLQPVSGNEAGQAIARYINIPLLKNSLSVKSSSGVKSKTKSKAKGNSKFNFYTSTEDLNSCNSDGLAFAKALFCPAGRLLAKHKSSSTRYLGPWGAELESSAVLVLKYLYVDRSFRRQGIARQLLKSLISDIQERTAKSKDGKGNVKFVVVFPAVIKEDFASELEGKSEDEREAIEAREYANAVGAYRAMGFRRIGGSKWFGLALEEAHASRGVTVEDDLDLEDEN